MTNVLPSRPPVNPAISMVANARAVATSEIDAAEAVRQIRDGVFKAPVERIRAEFMRGGKVAIAELKKSLPAFLWSGTFARRANDGLTAHSGLLCADMDALGDRVATVKNTLAADPHVYACFVSPSADGVKCVFRVPADAATHGRAFRTVARRIKELTGAEADEAAKDVARLCFASFDPDLHFNPEASELALDPEAERPAPRRLPAPRMADAPQSRREIAEFLLGEVRWVSEMEGFALCPGAAQHSSGDGKRDCRVNLDGAPTLFCVHQSCLPSVEAANRELRSRIGKAEWTPEHTEARRPHIETIPPENSDPEAVALQAALFKVTQRKELEPIEKKTAMSRAVKAALLARGRFFFHADFRDHATAMFFDGKRKLLLPLESDGFKSWLAFFIGINRTERHFNYVFSDLQDNALTGKTTGLVPELFWARRPDAIYLSNGDGRMVKVAAGHVATVDNGTDDVLFPVGRTLRPWQLTDPADPFQTCRLFSDLRTLAPHARHLLRLWTIALPSNQRCKPPLVLTGGVGSGKTKTSAGIAELFGLPPRVIVPVENGENDLWASLNGGGLTIIDNADTRIKWLPDALAAASTDGQREKRQLYTDSALVQQRANSWIAITSANPTFAADAGLADRILVVRLERREGDTAESALSEEIAANRDAGLSFIVQSLAAALADNAPVPGGLNQRHPDFAALAVRIGRSMDLEAETLEALRAAEGDKARFNLENDDLGAALIALVQRDRKFYGTAAEILDKVKGIDGAFSDARWTVKRVAKRLKAIFPHAQALLKASMEKGHGGYQNYSFGEIGEIESLFSIKS